MVKNTGPDPNISVLTPTHNRSRLLRLCAIQLARQNHGAKYIEWVVYDDSPTEEERARVAVVVREFSGCFANIVFRQEAEVEPIGLKRNRCVEMATTNILVNMDDDDFYSEHYVRYSYDIHTIHRIGLSGCSDMIITFPKEGWKTVYINLQSKKHIHEATMGFRREFWEVHKFSEDRPRGEGQGMLSVTPENHTQIFLKDIRKCIVCVAHGRNSFDKSTFLHRCPTVASSLVPIPLRDMYTRIVENAGIDKS